MADASGFLTSFLTIGLHVCVERGLLALALFLLPLLLDRLLAALLHARATLLVADRTGGPASHDSLHHCYKKIITKKYEKVKFCLTKLKIYSIISPINKLLS